MDVITESYNQQQYDSDYYYSLQYSPHSIDSYPYHSASYAGALPQPRKKRSSRALLLQRASPLTLENVSRVELADPTSMPLARYCNSIDSPNSVYSPSHVSNKKLVQRRSHEDCVLESPRILPFPYHNDSFFLPTAEHDYPGNCSTTDASSSIVTLSVCGSRQHLSSSSTSPSFYHPSNQRTYQRQLLSSPSKSQIYSPKRNDDDTESTYGNKRRVSSVTPSSASMTREDAVVPQKKHRSNNIFAQKFKANLLRFKTNSPILENNPPKTISPCTGELISEKKSTRQIEYSEKPKVKSKRSTWFERLWKFIKPSVTKKNDPSNEKMCDPVWYSQFKCSPPPTPTANVHC